MHRNLGITFSDFHAWFLVYWASTRWGLWRESSTRLSRSDEVLEPLHIFGRSYYTGNDELTEQNIAYNGLTGEKATFLFYSRSWTIQEDTFSTECWLRQRWKIWKADIKKILVNLHNIIKFHIEKNNCTNDNLKGPSRVFATYFIYCPILMKLVLLV